MSKLISTEQVTLSVSEITNSIKYTLETNFDSIRVIGEISNFKPHFSSGHWYFTLKDDKAQINCTMWSSMNARVFFKPNDGMKVILHGRISLYPPRGTYQLDAKIMLPAGEGELQAAFERLKKKLEAEGLFDLENKKEIPRFPEKIGIVTAVDSAAMKDMVRVAARRYPLAELVVIPTRVQGTGAAEEIVQSIKLFNKRTDIDVIIIARGGGSIEDLWAFNEEIVARAIADSKIPIISGVGHEIDYTISDFTADLRASTPTAAMELATPNKADIFAFLNEFIDNSESILLNNINNLEEEVESLIDSYGFRIIKDNIQNHYLFIDNVIYKMNNSIENKINNIKSNILIIEKGLKSNNIEDILKKGFTLISQNGKLVGRLKNFINESSFSIKFYDGEKEIN
ncbi:MAG: exodeoxyribonuclease VII large subunit [bacterium]